MSDRPTGFVRAAGVLAALLFAAAGARACDTPVYQYSMYEWRPDAYQVRYFHRAGEAGDASVNDRLRQAAPANLSFQAVAVSADGAVAPEHAAAWRGRSLSDLPLHVISAPGHGIIFAGRLDAEAAGHLLDSPRRRELAGELSRGRAGVLLVLTDPSTGDGDRVLRVARAAAAEASDGDRRVGVVSVRRDDPAERWFVRQLLAVEEDLADLAGSMVFGAFGRGRVLPPFVGAGVTAQGMRDLIAFIHGPCACELKAANPGLDLLMSWNWTERLPQWAAGSASQPGFMLFDFQVDPDAEGSGQAARVDPDAPAAPVTAAAPAEARAVTEARGTSSAATSAARTTAPATRVASTPAPEPEHARERPAPAATAAAPPAPPAATPPSPAAAELEAQEPITAQAPTPRLIARVPELPTTGQARLAAQAAAAEEDAFSGSLAARLGVIGLVLAALAGGGTLLLRRVRAGTDGGSAGNDG